MEVDSEKNVQWLGALEACGDSTTSPLSEFCEERREAAGLATPEVGKRHVCKLKKLIKTQTG